jgi:hypothetical protein
MPIQGCGNVVDYVKKWIMSLRPDHLFLESSALLYFCGWLWLSVSTAVIPLRQFARRQFGVAIGIVLILSATIWGYLFIGILAAGQNPVQVPLTVELLLIVIMATTYFPLKPWSSHPVDGTAKFVRTARIELVAVLIGLPIAGMAILAPFVSDISLWSLFISETYPVILVLIVALAIYRIAVCEPKIGRYLLAALVVLTALATTYVMLLTTLVVAV